MTERRRTPTVYVGPVPLGGGHPVVVQAMTNTDTADAEATARQIKELAEAGAELVRVTVNTEAAARAVPEIKERLKDLGTPVPLVGDFHFSGHILLRKYPQTAEALDKYRINPGTLGKKRKDEAFAEMIAIARELGKPVRIGGNWGSLDMEVLAELMDENARRPEPRPGEEVVLDALVESVVRSAEAAVEQGLPEDKIVLSAKVSRVPELIRVYRELARRTNLPLHLGLTEAGMGTKGIVASTAALAPLLLEGIGETIRVSLTPRPGEPRTREVEVAWEILQALGLRRRAPEVSACPGCGRTSSDRFQRLAERVEAYMKARLPEWKRKYPGVENLKVAVMGCVVNGPGESKHADIGISLPGAGEDPRAPVYADGQHVLTLEGADLEARFLEILEDYVAKKYGS